MSWSLLPTLRLCTLTLTSSVVLLSSVMASDQPIPGPLGAIEAKAKGAKSHDPQAVRAYVDAILDQAHLSVAPESVRGRLAKAELKFHRKEHKTISEAEFVEACNRTAADFKLPDYARTSGAQVHVFRMMLGKMAPSTIGASGQSTDMTPAEAVFVALQLAGQKVFNPDYQVPPDQWVDSTRPKNNHAEPKESLPVSRLHQVPQGTTELLNLIAPDAPGNRSDRAEVEWVLHHVMDSLGISR